MFELSIAKKYLLPRWRELSVSIISLISIFVIALVVWLILVFFSVTNGLEKLWTDKLVAMTAPVRVMPTPEYYQSYYFLVDGISTDADYAYRSLGEKWKAAKSDPYDPHTDEALPSTWPKPDLDSQGRLKDPVKLAFQAIENLHGVGAVQAADFEMTMANLRLRLARRQGPTSEGWSQSFINQTVYLGSFDGGNPFLHKTLLPLHGEDEVNLVDSLSISQDDIQTESPLGIKKVSRKQYAARVGQSGQGELVQRYAIHQGLKGEYVLPQDLPLGGGIVLPKGYREGGVRLGDQGYISYYAPGATSIQEQRIPIYVSGFYDQGVMPIGGKFVLVNPSITTMIRATYQHNDNTNSTGINVRFKNLEDADKVKEQLQTAFTDLGISKYWHIETYKEFDFTKDILQELKSQKNLFLLISSVIILVACSNIISMLIILVNDKKVEIGIFRALGASSLQIAALFSICGLVMGLTGSILGILFATLTLRYLDNLISLLSALQGHEMFNQAFYGDIMPNELSYEALWFVLIATVVTSLLAALVPAIKASILKPAEILRSE